MVVLLVFGPFPGIEKSHPCGWLKTLGPVGGHEKAPADIGRGWDQSASASAMRLRLGWSMWSLGLLW